MFPDLEYEDNGTQNTYIQRIKMSTHEHNCDTFMVIHYYIEYEIGMGGSGS